MIQEVEEGHALDNSFRACEPGAADRVLHFSQGRCLVRATPGEGCDLVELPRLSDYRRRPQSTTYLFAMGPERLFLALDDEVDADPDAGLSYEDMGWLRHVRPQHVLFAAATAAHLERWYRANRFCGRCGHPMELAPRSRELVCPECCSIVYPKICPGVICAVCHEADDPADDAIVLTRYNGRTTALWALVAGFTEIGEPLEGTVAREVMEEVGLRVCDLRFYKSQPWGFTDTLMAGFWCMVDGGTDIAVDHSELREARWFRCDEVPLERVGDRASLTGEMIERFRLMGREAWRS